MCRSNSLAIKFTRQIGFSRIQANQQPLKHDTHPLGERGQFLHSTFQASCALNCASAAYVAVKHEFADYTTGIRYVFLAQSYMHADRNE